MLGSAAMTCYSGFDLEVGGFAVCGLRVIACVLIIVLVGSCGWIWYVVASLV